MVYVFEWIYHKSSIKFIFQTDWISEQSWDNITELDKVAGFHGIVDSFEQNAKAWQGRI